MLLLVLAVVALAGAVERRVRMPAEGVAGLAERAGLETALDTTRIALRKASLRYMGFQQGMDAVPDSVRMAQAGIIAQRGMVLGKRVTTLETEERRLVASIDKIDTRLATITDTRHQTALRLGVLAGVLFLAGGLLLGADHRRLAA
jgi:hypothetical protein